MGDPIQFKALLRTGLKLIEAIDTFADECQDISTLEEFCVSFCWRVSGRLQEHFLTILHVKSTDTCTINKALISYLQEKDVDYRKLVGQGYDWLHLSPAAEVEFNEG